MRHTISLLDHCVCQSLEYNRILPFPHHSPPALPLPVLAPLVHHLSVLLIPTPISPAFPVCEGNLEDVKQQ